MAGMFAVCTREQAMKRSFHPLKRKLLCEPSSKEMFGYPPTKQFVSEDLVAAHLQHLNLSTDTPLNSHSPSSGGRTLEGPNIGEPQLRLQMKTVASCPHSVECQVSRKRPLMDYCGSGEEMVQDSWASKRLRLDDSLSFGHCRCQDDDSREMLATNLASIPEDAELNQQVVASTIHSSVIKTEELPPPSHHINSTLPSLSSLHSPPVGSGDDVHPYLVWVAPEIQGMTDSPPLPASIMEEITSVRSKMAVVPWVGVDTLLLSKSSDVECVDDDEQAMGDHRTSTSTGKPSYNFKTSK